MNPLVSICIPTYNRENTILDALNCALNQTYSNIEILISDDHSSDNTVQLVKKVSDPRIRLVVQKKNLGMIPNWNFCINEAKGKYIKFLHSDDLIDKNCVEKELSFFEKNKNVSLITCKRKFIDENGEVINTMQFSDKTTIESGQKYAREILTKIRENRIGEPSAVMFKKKDAIEVGLFDSRFSQLADFEFWLRLHALGDIGYINDALCSFRLHKGSNTTAAIRDGRFIDETYVFIDKYYGVPKYKKIFHLSDDDRKQVQKIKTLDFLKNIKILLFSADIKTALVYFGRISKYVSILDMITSSINHQFSRS